QRHFPRSTSRPVALLWRTHSCVPGRDSSRPLSSRNMPCVGVSAGAARTSACATVVLAASTLVLLLTLPANAELVPDGLIRTLLEEISADNALRETAAIASHSRYPDSQGFFDAAEHVAARARELGLQSVRIERFPGQRPLWDPVEAELSLVRPGPRVLS